MSSSTPKPFIESNKKNLVKNFSETDFLLSEPVNDPVKLAAEGIERLFTHFPRSFHTFQFIKTKAKINPVKCISDQKVALRTCLEFNRQGYDVFFMVNTGDGQVHEGKVTQRSQESVTELTNCFIDTDACPLTNVTEYLEAIGITPHLIIESSPDRYHIYIHIEPVPSTAANIFRWKAVQNILHRLGDPAISNPTETLGMDRTMNDHAKLLRVPGFFHVKKQHLVNIVEENDLPPYILDELFTKTEAQHYLDYTKETHGSYNGPSHVPDLDPTLPRIQAGERFASLQSLSMWLANETDKSEGEKFDIYSKFVVGRLDNTDKTYAIGSTLTKKSIDLFDSANKKKHRENLQQESKLQTTLVTKDTPAPSPWILPDSFYLDAPNGFGDVIRQVMSYSLYPCASLAFGTFLTGLSLLRARTHLTPTGSSPAIYTLNVAPTGYGKNAPMAMLQNTFVANGLGRLISNIVRSDRGIYNHLASNNGNGILILDEIAPLLRAIQQKDANSHLANISQAFLHLYSAGAMKGISLGKVTSSNTKKGEPEIVIDNPMLAICGYTVPSQFYTLFNSDSVAEGLFQRFIPIVADIRFVEPNQDADSQAVIKSELFKNHLPEATACEYNDADSCEEDPGLVEKDSNFDGSCNHAHIAGEGLITPARIRCRYSEEAKVRFNALQLDYRRKLIAAAQDPDQEATAGLYSRLAEQVERVATVLSVDEEIEIGTLEYAISFLESRHKAIMAVAGDTVLRGKGGEASFQEQKIIGAISRICAERECGNVTQADIYQRVRRNFKNYTEFENCIRDAMKNELVESAPREKYDQKSTRRWRLAGVIGS